MSLHTLQNTSTAYMCALYEEILPDAGNRCCQRIVTDAAGCVCSRVEPTTACQQRITLCSYAVLSCAAHTLPQPVHLALGGRSLISCSSACRPRADGRGVGLMRASLCRANRSTFATGSVPDSPERRPINSQIKDVVQLSCSLSPGDTPTTLAACHVRWCRIGRSGCCAGRRGQLR